MLSVSSPADTTKTVTLHYTLETFSFGSTDYINVISFFENSHIHGVTKCFFIRECFKFHQFTLGLCICFRKMPPQRCRSVLLFLLIISELNSGIAILFLRAYLRYH